MSSTPVASVSSQNSIDQLIQKVMSAVDANQDGQLSTTEFGAFLEKLLGGSGQAAAANVLTPSITGDPAGDFTAPTATQILPSTWTDNNAPYGVTFAGFSPLSYGDEYIHSAPNGYGMAPSTYNANADRRVLLGFRIDIRS